MNETHYLSHDVLLKKPIEKLHRHDRFNHLLQNQCASNLEVAAEENIIPLNELYEYCETIRNITNRDGWRVASVTASKNV